MKSKKITAMVVLAVMSCSILFAAEAKKDAKKQDQAISDRLEFTLTPALGVSQVFGFSLTQFDIGFHAAMLGLPNPAKEWYRNLMYIVNIDLGIGGKLKIYPNDKTDSAVLFRMSVLCGYSFKPVKNLYLTPAFGLGFTAGSIKTTSTIETPAIGSPSNPYYYIPAQKTEVKNVYKLGGLCLAYYFGIKYFFTDLIGIEATFIDTMTIPITSGTSFSNTLVFKVGPTFKLGMKV